MEKTIRRILMPIYPDTSFLPEISQIAELAQTHKAVLHLLFIGDIGFYQSYLPWLLPKTSPLAETKIKLDLLNLWKERITKEYGIRVTTSVEWGKWRSTLLHYISANDIDLIVLHERAIPRRKFALLNSNLTYIIEKSPCQVITLFTNPASAKGWQQVVIPVTDFIPELRIQTILETAVSLKLKIHLVTVTAGEIDTRTSDFYFLTETLKRLKPAGNIQVECKCLKNSFGPIDSFLQYTRSVGADILMTRMANSEKNASNLKEMNFHLDY
jgi:nucleotide-binding universal stress UspA family protein